MTNNYPKVFVEYYIRKPDTPQVFGPFKKFKYFLNVGVCEKESKAFWTPEQAQAWILEHPELQEPRIHDERSETPIKIKSPRRIYWRKRY